MTVIDRLDVRRVPGRRFVLGDAADPAVLLEAGHIVVALCEPGREHVLHDLLTRC